MLCGKYALLLNKNDSQIMNYNKPKLPNMYYASKKEIYNKRFNLFINKKRMIFIGLSYIICR